MAKRWNEHNPCGRAISLLRAKGKKACATVNRLHLQCFDKLYRGHAGGWGRSEVGKQYRAASAIINHTCDLRLARYGVNTRLYKSSAVAARKADESLKGARRRKRRRR